MCADTKTHETQLLFRRSPDYRLLPATGGWGGVTPQGQVILEFYIDTREDPESLILEVDESGKGEEKGRTGPQKLIREISVGVLLRPDHAYRIGSWLQEKAKEGGFTIQEGEE